MKTIKTPIIPLEQTFARRENSKRQIDKKALCIFAASGFFLERDSFYTDEQVLQPGTDYVLDADRNIQKQTSYFKWFHEPRNISFNTALDEFTDLFENIVKEQTGNNQVLLPLSGGLDSRSQAVALKHIKADVHSYSYSFENGFKEHKISEQIAKVCGFRFDPLIVRPNYLWKVLDEAASINQCYSDFIHPRQMAFLEQFKNMQGEFSLGHWGDVLFDRGIDLKDEGLTELDLIYKKVIKKGGLALASALWDSWNLDGDFESYLKTRIQTLLDQIDVSHKGAKIRAFKSLYWAPRWTSVSISFFQAAHPVQLPYYDDRMCQFICEIPEAYLADRKLQIAYIKNRNPNVAAIPWQDHMPFNLYNSHKDKAPHNLPYQIKNKISREAKALFGKKYIQRNWELQFLGDSNDAQLRSHLYEASFLDFVGKEVVDRLYNKFKTEDAVFYSHAVSMLLTLSIWNKKFNKS
ncbi:asparagine synthase-related protein [Gelidibacter japonicus]|uniref:asparagine synthase-related protein n=1 Tax=Gelidibacter japonicus TaxID=1962232 RepID=UPI0020214EA5|nr:asparagine synthase-related protein [Gelidibacter japonicus]MCL8006543.1 asparagine synthase-related protein [Gelidibacter japonicus]